VSWAAHNPEAYDEICKRGISWKLQSAYKAVWNDHDGSDFFDEIIETIHQEAPEVYEALLLWACKETNEELADHFASMGDARRKEGG